MDLLRAAYLLENELSGIAYIPAWKRRDLDNVARAAVRAMREAAERIERLEAAQQAEAARHPIPLRQPR